MGISLQAGEELKAVAQGQCGMLRLLRQKFVVEAAAVADAVARQMKRMVSPNTLGTATPLPLSKAAWRSSRVRTS